MRTDPAEILEAAADLYESETVEWCKGSFFNNKTSAERFSPTVLSACAWGAIIHAATEDHGLSLRWISGVPVQGADQLRDLRKGLSAAVTAVQDKLDDIQLPDFNDTVAKDKQEIIDLLKETAKDLRNKA